MALRREKGVPPMWLNWIKSALSQIILAAIVIGAFLALWVTQVPSARPWLDQVGISEMLGLPPAQDSLLVAEDAGSADPSRRLLLIALFICCHDYILGSDRHN